MLATTRESAEALEAKSVAEQAMNILAAKVSGELAVEWLFRDVAIDPMEACWGYAVRVRPPGKRLGLFPKRQEVLCLMHVEKPRMISSANAEVKEFLRRNLRAPGWGFMN